MEIGNKNEELILNSSGNIKIRFGDKFIEMLDENGYVKPPYNIYTEDDKVYIDINGETYQLQATKN